LEFYKHHNSFDALLGIETLKVEDMRINDDDRSVILSLLSRTIGQLPDDIEFKSIS